MRASWPALPLLLAATIAAGDPVRVQPEDGPRPWEGLYLGGHLGLGRGGGRTSLSGPVHGDSQATFGLLDGGVQVGYAHLLRARLLLGIEADVSVPNFLDGADRVALVRAGTSRITERMECTGSVRGRLGYARGRWSGYGAGGLAWGLARYDRRPLATAGGEEAWRLRPGWTVGAGAALALSAAWSARLEYRYDHLERATASFSGGELASSTHGLHRLQLALEWHAGWPGSGAAGGRDPGAARGDLWSIHGQFTFVGQGHPRFHSPYRGANSLTGAGQFRNTESATLFAGVRVWRGGELYVNPELMQGYGLDDVHGVAAFPNGEAQKSSFLVPRFNVARAFVSQTFSLGGATEKVEDAPNQVAGVRRESRVTVVVGKYAVLDYFLVNSYAGEPRTTFLNWNVYGGGAYDWTMDRLSWTWGALVDVNQRRWAARAGYFLMPVESNANRFDTHIPERGQFMAEGELRYAPFSRPGKLLLTAWLSRGFMGSYAEALAEDPATPAYPDITLVRRVRTNYGFVVSAEQALGRDLGVFSRASWNAGRVEMMGWTDCNASLSLGAALKGARWRRPNDTIGVAGLFEGLSYDARRYLAAGGLGILVGDGKLRYHPEGVLETYYAFSPFRWATLTLDYQLIVNPGYNADRGPVSIFSLRAHLTF